MNINEAYLKFYCKDFGCRVGAFKLSNDECIKAAVAGTKSISMKHDVHKDICIFNPFSLTNVMRKMEHDVAWMSEADAKTVPTKDFIDEMISFYKKMFSYCKACVDAVDDDFDVECLYPNADRSIYGEVKFSFLIDLSKHDVDHYVRAMVRRAYLMNYNMLDFEVSRPKKIIYDGAEVECVLLIIRFEAAYQDGVAIGFDRYAYHVTTKNAADKIMSRGILPKNCNLQGFRYPDRVYVFVSTKSIGRDAPVYAMMSGKKNKTFLNNDYLKTLPKDEVEKLIDEFKSLQCTGSSDGIVIDDRKFVILQIDLSKVGDIKFYRDYATKFDREYVAAYTYKPIPAKAITCYREIYVPELKHKRSSK